MTAQCTCTPMQWYMSKSINPFRASLCLDSSYVVLELEVKNEDNNGDDDDTIVLMMMLIVIVSPMM